MLKISKIKLDTSKKIFRSSSNSIIKKFSKIKIEEVINILSQKPS